jgi:hypothetical protein
MNSEALRSFCQDFQKDELDERSVTVLFQHLEGKRAE